MSYIQKVKDKYKKRQPPPLTTRLISYEQEHDAWVAAGKPVRSQAEVEEIFNTHCKGCWHYDGKICNICGCMINTTTGLNKLHWATTKCPDTPSKWGEKEEPIKKDSSVGDKPTPLSPEPPVAKPKKKKGGCGCGR